MHKKTEWGAFLTIFHRARKSGLLGWKECTNYNSYLITGLDKVDAFPDNPFASYIERFAKDVIESGYIVLVGTSFNDYHLNPFLANVISVVPSLKIICVTKWNTKPIKEWFPLGGGDNILFIPFILFKDSIKVKANLDPYQELDERLDNSKALLDRNVYAILTEHFLLYTKGTEEFYKESDIELLWQKASTT